MFRQSRMALTLINFELRAMTNLRGVVRLCIDALIQIAPLLLATIASMALHWYILKELVQNQLVLMSATNLIGAISLASKCRDYFLRCNKKFPRRIFNQSTIEIIIWKGTILAFVSLPYGLAFSVMVYSPAYYLHSVTIFFLLAAIFIILVDVLATLLSYFRNYRLTVRNAKDDKIQCLVWSKYFFSFRWNSANGQAGFVMAIALLIAAMYFIEESLLLSLFLFCLAVSFIFFELVTENLIRHKIFVYSDTSSLSFFVNSYGLAILLYLTITLIAFGLSYYAFGSTFLYVLIPISLITYTLYDSLALLSVSGDQYKKFIRRFLMPLGIVLLVVFNPIIGLILLAGTTVWLYLGFNNRCSTIPDDYQFD